LLSDIDPLSLVEVDERGASAVDVAEKALQFPVMDGESGRARTQRGLIDPCLAPLPHPPSLIAALKQKINSDSYVVLLIEREMEASKVIS
jgi:hypothetical protein